MSYIVTKVDLYSFVGVIDNLTAVVCNSCIATKNDIQIKLCIITTDSLRSPANKEITFRKKSVCYCHNLKRNFPQVVIFRAHEIICRKNFIIRRVTNPVKVEGKFP